MGKWKRQKQGDRTRTREREVGDGTRTVRLQELIREEVNFTAQRVRDPRLEGVVITRVELAGEACARLWFTSENEEDRREACEPSRDFSAFGCRSLGLETNARLRFRRDPATGWPVRWRALLSTTINGCNVPIRVWAPEGDRLRVIAQLRTSRPSPGSHPVAVMPDVHAGRGDRRVGDRDVGAIAPAAVSVDISCGMAAVGPACGPRSCPMICAGCGTIQARFPSARDAPAGDGRRRGLPCAARRR
jgi:ribosome-binding factor A